jgi:glycyl-tRNA synthetase beta subunit
MARRQAVPQLLKRLLLSHGDVSVESTPRRLAVIVRDVAAKQPNLEEKIRGPPAKVAVDQALNLSQPWSLQACLGVDNRVERRPPPLLEFVTDGVHSSGSRPNEWVSNV